MKSAGRNGVSHVAEAELFDRWSPHAQEAAADLAARLEQSHIALAELREVLAANERQSVSAREKLEELTQTNSRLRQELLRLTHKEAKTRHFAYHDELTGLPNRRLLLDRLDQAIAMAARRHKQVALLFFDLDGFKSINDRLGHATGDKLLVQVARRLSGCLRSADTACRYGGDEFVIMLPEIDDEENAALVEHKIRARLAIPYMIDDNTVTVVVSIGAAVYPLDGKTSLDLIKRADHAMYRAKADSDTGPGFPQHALISRASGTG